MGYATDNKDGDLTSEVKITGEVDITTLGKYTITYEVKDKSGNMSSQTRTVNVVRKNPSQMTWIFWCRGRSEPL